MAKVRTVDFLPEIFQTNTNRQFLAATLDQLVQEPKFQKIQGFIGRRVGPGVNPGDRYIVEDNKVRADYQLEPGIISLKPGTSEINDAITYPGLLDSIALQGGNASRPDRLFASQYYTWDPFIDWDTFVNFSQYFWLADGPDSVDVAATTVPETDNYDVTRANGVYTFSGLHGENPTIELVRGGSYTFQVAQNRKETVNFRVSNEGTSAYVIDFQSNPTLTLVRGNTYVFTLNLNGILPFFIKTAPTTGLTNIYNSGVTNNGATVGTITFVVPQDAPDTLFYACSTQPNLQGQINVVNGTPGTGSGFWIQTNPGVSGKNPIYNNISSRQVLGVSNNGEDLGTVTFNVPLKSAQNFYYGLNDIGGVDFITDLKFDQINNVPVSQLPSLDGISNLDGRTIVFRQYYETAELGGWRRTSFFDPLAQETANNGLAGSYDSLPFDQETLIPENQRYDIWKINVVNNQGYIYYQLSRIAAINIFDKFTIRYGDTWANTQWYKNEAGIFRQIPLLTATLDTLYYQDGTDPEIFGQIKIVDPVQSNTLFIDQIIDQPQYTSPNGVVFTNGLKVVFRGDVEPASYQNKEYYVSGVGTAIRLNAVENFITPESYIVNDADDSTVGQVPTKPDYITIDRGSQDLNAWTRSNRWFHIDVINATAVYNNTEPVIDNQFRAKRPIIQFRPGIRLFNMGTQGKAPVNVIDFEQTDALSNVEGATSYSIDGYNLVQGSRVIFAKDLDQNVRNKIYVVNFVVPDSVPPLIAQPVIHLTLAQDGAVEINQSTVCLDGSTTTGITYWFDGLEWIQAQQKTAVQQAPLYDVYDSNGTSYSNRVVYPSSDFVGTKLFSYAVGNTNLIDPILQFPLQYLNINNVGDIVFDNNLYTDSFVFVRDNISVTESISNGFVYEYSNRTEFARLLGWTTAATESVQRQQFKFTYDGTPLKLDIRVESIGGLPPVQVFQQSRFVDPSLYSVETTDQTTQITLTNGIIGEVIEVLALSTQTSQVAFYEVPVNLENNPLNQNSNSFTLGTIRTHYESICQNLASLSGPINGANNTRDLGRIGVYGQIILQQSAPLTLTGYFNRSRDFNIFESLQYNSKEYQKYKDIMLNEVTQLFIQNETPAQILTQVINNITAGRTSSSPFYWSDMLPSSSVFVQNSYTVTFTTTNTFDTVQVYNYTSANYLAMNVYLNNVILVRGKDYVVATDGPRITVLTALNIGDVLTIQEFQSTYGSYVPNTPSKMGLYPAFRPEIKQVRTTTGTATVIVGHDGSQTPIFGDVRDQVLLEFETRIFNNIKMDGNPVPLTADQVIPGQFRTTGYSFNETNFILGTDFLSYVGWNKLDYNSQRYDFNNQFTYNYSQSQNKLSPSETLLGAWRGINRYFYDTQDPSLTPWEMLGLSIKPDWWEDTYGPAPYTQDNLVLWDDIAQGLVADPVAPYVVPLYVRPRLTEVIPSGTQGELLPPLQVQVGNYNDQTFQKSWAVGDGGPVEASWWNSSAYPFAVMRLLALTKPAKFYSYFADRDLYRYSQEFDQFLYNGRFRLDANGVQVYGDGVSKASYINWIVDYNRQLGLNSTEILRNDLANIDVRLCYRMAGFSDKNYIKIYTEKSSPNSINTTLLIPDESYDLLLYKNQPFDRTSYSGVIIQAVGNGYAVYGYSTSQPFFNILVSQGVGRLQTYNVAGVTVQVPTTYTSTVAQVPYGYVFTSLGSVCDFLLSYGKFLESQGMTFTDRANNYELNWSQMVVEFLYWSQQGWEDNALINLNPLASGFTITRAQSVADSIVSQTINNVVLDQNKRELPIRNLDVVRIDNTLTLTPLADQSLSFVDLKFVNFEHIIVLNNASQFGDLIYEPITGARQSRLNLIAYKSNDWNGTVDAQGFILNSPNIEEWTGLKKYTKGQIVKYKDQFWSALTIVEPSVEFDFNKWTKSDYGAVDQGLLPNIANKANQLQNTYSITTANLERDNDLLSFGLIGFRPRQYMAALNLDDISQVNVYSQFLGSKGTILATDLLGNANLGKEEAEYEIYENWAIQRAVYGANASRSFVELRLNRSLLNSNPSLVQVVLPQQTSLADQVILLNDVWRESYKLTSPDFMPTTFTTVTDTALPTAGYVNLDDVDILSFDLGDRSTILENFENVIAGATLWVARVNNYDWDVYRITSIDGFIDHICDNLDGTAIVNFTKPHGLQVGDRLIIKQFDSRVDGVYRVLTTEGINRLTIAYSFIPGAQTIINGVGIGFTIKSQRVQQASDIVNLSFANEIVTGNKVWVDDDGTGHWQVLEKQNQFRNVIELSPVVQTADEQFGVSVSQASNRFAALVGSPLLQNMSVAQGGVYVYVKNYQDQYQLVSPTGANDSILFLTNEGTRGFGNAVDFGSQTWAVAGASQSLGTLGQPNVGYAVVIYRDPALGQPGVSPYTISQLLVPPELPNSSDQGEFGYSVAMSRDERWMYIGAPGVNKVYAYGFVDWQDQFVSYVTDGFTTSYNINQAILINADTQIQVTVGERLQVLGTDYTVSPNFESVTFFTPPGLIAATGIIEGATYVIIQLGDTDFTAIGASANMVGVTFVATGTGSGTGVVDRLEKITIRRINELALDTGTYFDVSGTTTVGIGTGAEFTIVRRRNTIVSIGTTSNGINYAPGDQITIAGTSFGTTTNLVVTVSTVGSSGNITNFTYSWTPPALINTFSLNEYFYTATNVYSFSVYVDDVLYRPVIDYDFDDDNSTSGVDLDLTFVKPDGSPINPSTYPGVNANIVVKAKGYFEYVDTLTVPGLDANARFGHSVATTTDGRQVFVGAKDLAVNGKSQAGTVYVFDRNVQRFIYGTDPSTVDFTVLGTPAEPVSVIVNNDFLINQNNSVPNAVNSFTVNGNTVTINSDLAIGDEIEIETNQFKLMQTVTQSVPTASANFGFALDICSFNCSLYVGSPRDSTQSYRGGSVQRNVNQSRVYGTTVASVANPVLTAGHTIRVNNIDVAVPVAPNNTAAGLAQAINSTVPNVLASVTNGVLTVSVKNFDSSVPGNRLQVAPGSVGTAFDAFGFVTFAYTQTVYSPYPTDYAEFGYSVSINDTADNLVVGSPQGTMYLLTVFDDGTTFFDENSTIFFGLIVQSGVVYTFDYLSSANDTLANPGKFVFGVQISNSTTTLSYDRFGVSVSYVDGVLLVGSPGNDDASTQDGSSQTQDYGRVYVYENPNRLPAWIPVRQQQPVVDISLINSVFTYDRVTSAKTQQFDFFNPLQGKILGAARQNIDYISAVDPASYNNGTINNNGTTWFALNVGQIWWDTSTVRYFDPNQDDIVYASRRWSQLFPGSTVDVYQWIQSTVPPANYTGPGQVRNIESYSVSSKLGVDGVINTFYYFWVSGLTTAARNQGKTLALTTIANYIENPKASGIPYVAPLNASTIAIYNANDIIEAQDTVIHIEYDRIRNDNNVHVEYQLVADGRPESDISESIWAKIIDSFCGVDSFGNLVPDPTLNPAERYGVQFRPRQSIFVDRFEALRNYITRVNRVLAQFPIVENRSLALLNSREPEPPASQGSVVNWNMAVANLEILSFQDIQAVPLGYKYLVLSDARNNGLWTIYTVQLGQGPLASVRELALTRVQNYDTRRYWSYIDWYRPGYNSSVNVVTEIPNSGSLATLRLPVGSSVKVTANAQGKFEIYLLTDLGWERVGLEDGTIEISAQIYNYALGRFGFGVEVFDAQYFDQEPVIETRKIIEAVKDELFIGDLAIEQNRLLMLIFNYALSEFAAPEWLVKTSLIDVVHRIRSLVPFQNFRRDNQEFVLDYIQEVKPYHVQVREFNLLYEGIDSYDGGISDFDLPAYWNTNLEVPRFTSPILYIDDPQDPRYQQPYLPSTYQLDNVLSNTSPNSLIWQTWPYSQWFDNYLLTLERIRIVNPGSGYTEPPTVIVQGDAVTPATARAVLNSQGQVAFVSIIDAGSGYFSTPEIVFSGGNGSGVRAYAVMNRVIDPNFVDGRYTGLARSFKTIIKYDRYQYQTSIQNWEPGVSYPDGTLVRYLDRVWRADSPDSTAVNTQVFDLEDWQTVSASELSGVDRTMGFYVAGVNEPGLDLPLLIDGVDYPGVQVFGPYFLGSNPDPLTVTCTATSASTGLIACDSTFNLSVDAAIKFTDNVFGGLVQDQVYYVSSIFDQTHFSVTTQIGGFAVDLSDASGNMQAIVTARRDAIYSSSFADIYLGTRFTDINVDGGEFLGLYEGHAPEELVNGAVYDTLDLRVFTRPGSDWSIYDGIAGADGHGFQIGTTRQTYVGTEISWQSVVENPVSLTVSNINTELDLVLGVNYTVDWVGRTITILTGASIGDIINVSVYEVGGGSQLYRQNYVGNEVSDFLIVPVNTSEIYDAVVFVNGVKINVLGWEPYYFPSTQWNQLQGYSRLDVVFTGSPNTYYRALQDVPAGIDISNTAYWLLYVPTTASKVFLPQSYGANDALNITVMGFTSPVQFNWSTPQTQNILVTPLINSTKVATLSNSMQGTNIPNAVVEINGRRLRPYTGIEWFGDDSSISFGLPTRTGYSQQIINAPTDVNVWVDNQLQVQNIGFGGDYVVSNWAGTEDRQVVFATPPAAGARILISVSTAADYLIVGNQLQLVSAPSTNSVISVTTFNDTAQQNILTQVYQGPVTSGSFVQQPYDSTPFDSASVNDTPGTYDYAVGIVIFENNINLREGTSDPSRLIVTKNGYRLFDGVDYVIENNQVILASGTLAPSDILVVTQFTNSVVPEAMSFRIFQDMRGVQATYRITDATTTVLVQDLSSTADIAYLADASKLSEPDLTNGIFGICSIEGERIMYRFRDTSANTISGLMRGTAGTAAADHIAGRSVYDESRGNLLNQNYQDTVYKNSSIGNGTNVLFYAPDVYVPVVDPKDSSTVYIDHSIEVYVGGIRQYPITSMDVPSQYRYTIFTVDPVSDGAPFTVGVEFITDSDPINPLLPPPSGVEVTIAQRRAKSWYAPGATFPVNVTVGAANIGQLVIGQTYFIAATGNTDFTQLGADENRVGVLFTATATGAGAGNGTVTTVSDGVALQETDTPAARFLRGF